MADASRCYCLKSGTVSSATAGYTPHEQFTALASTNQLLSAVLSACITIGDNETAAAENRHPSSCSKPDENRPKKSRQKGALATTQHSSDPSLHGVRLT